MEDNNHDDNTAEDKENKMMMSVDESFASNKQISEDNNTSILHRVTPNFVESKSHRKPVLKTKQD